MAGFQIQSETSRNLPFCGKNEIVVWSGVQRIVVVEIQTMKVGLVVNSRTLTDFIFFFKKIRNLLLEIFKLYLISLLKIGSGFGGIKSRMV